MVSQRSSKNTLKLRFFDFYKYGCVYVDALSKLYDVALLLVSQRSSKNTLKLRFFYFYKYGCGYIVALSKLYDAALLKLILHVLCFAEKVEEHTKTLIFISKSGDFYHNRCVFFVVLSKLYFFG